MNVIALGEGALVVMSGYSAKQRRACAVRACHEVLYTSLRAIGAGRSARKQVAVLGGGVLDPPHYSAAEERLPTS